ncbi:MAG: twin-arginine translocation signal domain-containing protein, partial [Planctomycetes bacterium]|nr:twin-arginine translocation signal domain-containing protein [Planctomycetota bacterium]
MSNDKKQHAGHQHDGMPCHCCPDNQWHQELDLNRRNFLATAAVGGAVLGGLSWTSLALASESGLPKPKGRTALKVLPILVWNNPKRVPMRSWRSWGGIETAEQAAEEVARITKELAGISKSADFPVEFAEVASVNDIRTMANTPEVQAADAVIVYGAGSRVNGCQDFGKDVILFQRHRSGPVYLQYEIVSPAFLRQRTDDLVFEHIAFDDVVTDSQDELTWRLRALCGLKNTRSTKIICIGGAGGWAQPQGVIPELVQKVWGLDMQTVSYDELGPLIEAARADEKTVALAKKRADEYLALPQTTLETKREYVDNCFLLDQVFRSLMAKADCQAITILGCMGTIMPQALTSACLTLSTLNDDGYLAFCESDFVVIPSGMLLANISGRPVFLNDPTYPHDGVITLAHCTGPRKMNGKTLDPARIVTHFESDFGASPKVDMPKGQVLTNIAPDFKSERWMGLLGTIADAPFLPICRDQIDVAYDV